MTNKLFMHGWEFCLTEPDGRPTDYKPVDLPHDWLIYDAKNLYRDGDGWYRHALNVSCGDGGKRFGLRFDGLYMDSTVFLNGQEIFEWKYGYTAFDVPLNGITEGDNLIEVRVRHRAPNSRWYSGAGIYRSVRLWIKDNSEILSDGVYVAPRAVGDGMFATEIDTEVRGECTALIKHTVTYGDGHILTQGIDEVMLTPDAKTSSVTLPAFTPKLWCPDSPSLYTLKTELISNGETVDEVVQRIGYKTVEFTPNDGFFLNGSHLKLLGTCMHHDMGALGSAVSKTAIRRQLNILKEMGVNSIRTSHNPPAVEFLDLCDEMGFLVLDEAFDMWERKKNLFDYARFFPEWHARDVASWIRRDRSRACVFMWSIGNEISDTNYLPRGKEVTAELRDLVRLHDYKRLYPVTLGSNTMYTTGGQECAKELDVVGYNYLERIYDEHHEKYPDWIIYGSETSSTYQSRGVYHFPGSVVTSTYDDEQCSSLLNCATSYGAVNSEYNITIERVKRYSLGQYIWTALDYIGEPTPFHTKNSHFGHVDTAGFPKDTYYAYKAEWNLNTKPFVHLYPYWDFNEGQMIDLYIFSNCYESELWVNGECLGRHRHDHEGFGVLTGRWQVQYHKGEIKAIGYDESGNAVCEMTRRSFGDPAEISLMPDKYELSADGEDLIFIEISMKDSDGNPVENARNRVRVEVSGAGRLVGLDNGDSTDYDQYKGNSRRLFNGKLLAIVAAKDFAGNIMVKVNSPELPQASLKLKALPFDGTAKNCSDENYETDFDAEIPVRKIELKVDSQHMCPDMPEIHAEAKLLPENTTFTPQDIMFKVTNDAGIETNLAKIEFIDERAVIRAVGDGACRLRAYCKNATPFDAILSELELSITGFGPANFDPYGDTVSSSLCSKMSESMQVVMQGGLQTPECEVYIQYDNVDFGKIGSQELTVGIFSYSSEPIPFSLADGEGNILDEFVYQAHSRWNTYQYNTFRLSEIYRGMKNLRFIFHDKLRFKGFRCEPLPALGTVIPASQRDSVFGDQFTETTHGIENIGNNVTVKFNDIDLRGKTASKLAIIGRTRNASESIRFVIDSDEGQEVYTIEFSQSADHTERQFDIKPASGKLSVTLLYLPGCDFDLSGIRLL